MTLVQSRLDLPGGELRLLQPAEAAELPDDGPVQWAPLAPYWSVLWRSGVALARELDGAPLAGLRVAELGCGLGIPSLVAARAGARVLATDVEPEALELLGRNARENGLEVETACVDWTRADYLVARGPFDLVLAADAVYEDGSGTSLLELLPRLGPEAWLAEPGRRSRDWLPDRVRGRWSVTTTVRDHVRIHRLEGRTDGRGGVQAAG
ncbi:MAG TPA: methyltransferase domain-containing protein [Thermoleophilaceae bacterium]|nr:methyltransferase domain-containing protein [Thermoleophilaceae bacterium]